MKKARTIVTPTINTDLAEGDESLTYWKQILPQSTIHYSKGTQKRTIDFNAEYHRDIIEDFKAKKAIDQVHFQLAGPNNEHGRDMDPERQRALVIDMATYDELPDSVKQRVNGPGLYAKMQFFSKRAAKAVRRNPDLGVSARVRENFVRSDGTFVKRGIIHVLGTIDPRVTGMSGWNRADLSYDPDHKVLDLSNEHYERKPAMPKDKKSKASKNARPDDDAPVIPTDEEIDAFTDEELDAFLASDEDDGAEDEQDDDLEDEDDDDDDEDEDEHRSSRARETVSMSNRARSEIDLANARADAAESKADRALRRAAERDFADFAAREIALGVPPEKIDLCEEILTRPDGMIVDLSNEGGSSDLDVADIVRELLAGYRGTIDMSVESGHAGQFNNDGEDPDQDILDALAAGR